MMRVRASSGKCQLKWTKAGIMGRAGRKRKDGKREPNGRLQRVSGFDKGSDWVQAQRARYGEHYSTALGRAYAAGLLGEESEAICSWWPARW